MQLLESASNEADVKQVLSGILLIDERYTADEAVVVRDFYLLCYCFCKDNAFSSRKIAAFMSIMHEAFILDSSNTNPSWRSDRSYERLQDVIFQHSIQRPPKR